MAQHAAELFSIGLTIPTIVLAFYVIWLWGPKALKIVKSRRRFVATDWFILGVTLGFIGQVLDNTYWQITWCSYYLESSDAISLVQLGVWFNIVSRQTLGILAAYCHVRSYKATQPGNMRTLSLICFISIASGCAFSAFLHLLKCLII